MPLLLITVLRPMYGTLAHLAGSADSSGTDQAAAGMAVMFSLLALKVVGASMLNERTWNTWDRLRASPAGSGEILLGKAIPHVRRNVAQRTILFGFAAIAFGLRPAVGWWTLAVCIAAWSACVLLLGTAASHPLARSPPNSALPATCSPSSQPSSPARSSPARSSHNGFNTSPHLPVWAISPTKPPSSTTAQAFREQLRDLGGVGVIGIIQGIIINNRHREA